MQAVLHPNVQNHLRASPGGMRDPSPAPFSALPPSAAPPASPRQSSASPPVELLQGASPYSQAASPTRPLGLATAAAAWQQQQQPSAPSAANAFSSSNPSALGLPSGSGTADPSRTAAPPAYPAFSTTGAPLAYPASSTDVTPAYPAPGTGAPPVFPTSSTGVPPAYPVAAIRMGLRPSTLPQARSWLTGEAPPQPQLSKREQFTLAPLCPNLFFFIECLVLITVIVTKLVLPLPLSAADAFDRVPRGSFEVHSAWGSCQAPPPPSPPHGEEEDGEAGECRDEEEAGQSPGRWAEEGDDGVAAAPPASILGPQWTSAAGIGATAQRYDISPQESRDRGLLHRHSEHIHTQHVAGSRSSPSPSPRRAADSVGVVPEEGGAGAHPAEEQEEAEAGEEDEEEDALPLPRAFPGHVMLARAVEAASADLAEQRRHYSPQPQPPPAFAPLEESAAAGISPPRRSLQPQGSQTSAPLPRVWASPDAAAAPRSGDGGLSQRPGSPGLYDADLDKTAYFGDLLQRMSGERPQQGSSSAFETEEGGQEEGPEAAEACPEPSSWAETLMAATAAAAAGSGAASVSAPGAPESPEEDVSGPATGTEVLGDPSSSRWQQTEPRGTDEYEAVDFVSRLGAVPAAAAQSLRQGTGRQPVPSTVAAAGGIPTAASLRRRAALARLAPNRGGGAAAAHRLEMEQNLRDATLAADYIADYIAPSIPPPRRFLGYKPNAAKLIRMIRGEDPAATAAKPTGSRIPAPKSVPPTASSAAAPEYSEEGATDVPEGTEYGLRRPRSLHHRQQRAGGSGIVNFPGGGSMVVPSGGFHLRYHVHSPSPPSRAPPVPPSFTN